MFGVELHPASLRVGWTSYTAQRTDNPPREAERGMEAKPRRHLFFLREPERLWALNPDSNLCQVRRAIAWLDPRVEPSEMRRLAAVLLLREMAEQSPAVFNVHVKVGGMLGPGGTCTWAKVKGQECQVTGLRCWAEGKA